MNTTQEIPETTIIDADANDSTPTEPSQAVSIEEELARAATNLLRVGSLWARHGLQLGQMGLETSARTLKITADTLGALKDSLAADKDYDEAA